MNLQNFISKPQYQLLSNLAQTSGEHSFYENKLTEIEQTINTMPQTYGTDGQGYDAVAYLHYFKGGSDFYIVEKDVEDKQLQAFGVVNIGYGAELGYISIDELLSENVELDLYFSPVKVKELII